MYYSKELSAKWLLPVVCGFVLLFAFVPVCMGHYGLHVEILFWVIDLSLSKDTKSQLLEDIVRMFNENNIKIVHHPDASGADG